MPNILTRVLLVGVGSPSTSLPDRGHLSAMANTRLSLDVYLEKGSDYRCNKVMETKAFFVRYQGGR